MRWPGYGTVGGRRDGGHVEGAAAEQAQHAHARGDLALSIAGQPIAQTRQGRGHNTAYLDVLAPPQVFARRPRVSFEPGPDEPVNQFVPHLPGRIPPAGWDGEPGAASPTAGWI